MTAEAPRDELIAEIRSLEGTEMEYRVAIILGRCLKRIVADAALEAELAAQKSGGTES